MEKFEYFANENVPITVTNGVQEKLSRKLIGCLLELVFERKKELDRLGVKMNELQVFTIETEQAFNDTVTVYKITIKQEKPECKSVNYAMEGGGYTFSGKVYVIENWNGKKENVTLDDHYISMCLPSER